jgi:hypothetical protein
MAERISTVEIAHNLRIDATDASFPLSLSGKISCPQISRCPVSSTKFSSLTLIAQYLRNCTLLCGQATTCLVARWPCFPRDPNREFSR